MREYELIIDEALKNGLINDAMPINSLYLHSALGFRCGRSWLENYARLTNPLTLDLDYSWPFPQFFAGNKYPTDSPLKNVRERPI